MRITLTRYITASVGTLLTNNTSISAQVSLPRLFVSYQTGMLNSCWMGNLNAPNNEPIDRMLLVNKGP